MRTILLAILLAIILALVAHQGGAQAQQPTHTLCVPYVQTTGGCWTGVAVRCPGGDVRMDVFDGNGQLVDYLTFCFNRPCTIKHVLTQEVDAGQLVFSADQPFMVTVGIGNDRGWSLETHKGEWSYGRM